MLHVGATWVVALLSVALRSRRSAGCSQRIIPCLHFGNKRFASRLRNIHQRGIHLMACYGWAKRYGAVIDLSLSSTAARPWKRPKFRATKAAHPDLVQWSHCRVECHALCLRRRLCACAPWSWHKLACRHFVLCCGRSAFQRAMASFGRLRSVVRVVATWLPCASALPVCARCFMLEPLGWLLFFPWPCGHAGLQAGPLLWACLF